MIYYIVLIQDFSKNEKKEIRFQNKYLIKNHLKNYNNAYIEIEMNRCIETFYIKRYNQEIWIEI